MSKAGVLRTSKWGTVKKGKAREAYEFHARFTLRCDFCVARNRFGVDSTVEWNPMQQGTEVTFDFKDAIPEATEMSGWGYIPASTFPVHAGASNDRNFMFPAVRHVCSLCMAQHFPEDDR